MSSSSSNSNPSSPLEWIHLELIPLPDKIEHLKPCIVWWNPNTGEILGNEASFIINLIKEQLSRGSVTNSMGTIELSDPFTKPSELASVLGQYFWVIPVPVAQPYEKVEANNHSTKEQPSSSIH